MKNNDILMKIEVKNENVRNTLEKIIGSIEGLLIQSPRDASRADLLIFELGTEIEHEFQIIKSLLQGNEAGEVFITSVKADPDVLMQTIKTGVKEFFAQPLQEDEVRQALEMLKKRKGSSEDKASVKSAQIVSVIGSKGGVGTTTVAVNLVMTLAEHNADLSAALIDMNTLFGEIPLFLEITPKYDWGEITRNISRLDRTFLMNILSKHTTGVCVLPSPCHLNNHEPMNPKTMERILRLMQGMFNFVVIDCGHSLGESALKSLEMSDNVLLISDLSLPCLSNTGRLLKSLSDFGYPVNERIKIVVNRYAKKSEISLNDAENGINKKISWIISNDYKTAITAINQGQALSQIAPKARITKDFKKLADALISKEDDKEKKQWSLLKKLIKGKQGTRPAQ
jgi:pilus assembly protein CpaE